MGNPYLNLKASNSGDYEAIANLSKLLHSTSKATSSKGNYISPLKDASKPAKKSSYKDPNQSILKPEKFEYHSSLRATSKPAETSSYKDPKQSIADNKAKIEQEKLEAEARLRAESERRKIVEIKAQEFLSKIDALDPLDSNRLWFEQYAEKCESRLEASIDFILNDAV